jgi:hypothetical protein
MQDAGNGIGPIELAISRGMLDGSRRDGVCAVSAGIDERMLTQNIDNARDAARIGVDATDGVWLENRRAIGSRYAEPLLDVAAGLFKR